MKKIFFCALILVNFSACKKEKPVEADYRDIFTGYYPVIAACTTHKPDSTSYSTSDAFTIKVIKLENDSSVKMIAIKDSIASDYLTFRVDAFGNFQSDSIPGQPRAYNGKFSAPNILYFKTHVGNSLGSTTCAFSGRKQANL